MDCGFESISLTKMMDNVSPALAAVQCLANAVNSIWNANRAGIDAAVHSNAVTPEGANNTKTNFYNENFV